MDENDTLLCKLIAGQTLIFNVAVVVCGVVNGVSLDLLSKGICAVSLIGLFAIACIASMGMEE